MRERERENASTVDYFPLRFRLVCMSFFCFVVSCSFFTRPLLMECALMFLSASVPSLPLREKKVQICSVEGSPVLPQPNSVMVDS